MIDKLTQLIKYSCESHALDFKKEQYPIGKHPKKFELIKDLIAMANHPSDEDKFIIVGIKEKNGMADSFHPIEELTDEAKYQQLISSNVTPSLTFEYKPFNYEGKELAYFRIYNNTDRPYLFQKDLVNPIGNSKNEFREGDGYIRHGTSTKKLGRSEFDEIYSANFRQKDRKTALLVKPYFSNSSNPKLANWNVKYLDISIENNSNASIDFEVEMKVTKDQSFQLISEKGLLDELDRRNAKKSGPFDFGLSISDINPISFHTSIEEDDDLLIISRTKMRHEKTAVNLAQAQKEKDIFCQNLFVLYEGSITINIEVVIRSDDFTEGPLIKSFEVNSETDIA